VPVKATIIDLSRGGIDWDIYGALWKADTKLERELLSWAIEKYSLFAMGWRLTEMPFQCEELP
jgi:hypothetical protein